jgi:hypothetical protein
MERLRALQTCVGVCVMFDGANILDPMSRCHKYRLGIFANSQSIGERIDTGKMDCRPARFWKTEMS